MTGLFGGFGHCIGMCGPVVAVYSFGFEGRGSLRHLLFSAGRITTYAILGGAMGLSGSFLGVAEPIAGFQTIAIGFVGCWMVIMGLSVAGIAVWPKALCSGLCTRISVAVHTMIRVISGAKGVGTYFPMGMALGLIPCGLLYTALISAAGAGAAASSRLEGFISGVGLLAFFGLGTVPALFSLGHLVAAGSESFRQGVYRISGLLMALTGLFFIYRAANL
ncbi:MAG TPA: sulfite exporter TauE/SafE family protein [Dissulfurispiraceae bacterium]|nr:sulfite exporter TauE/SafE family protein [Dissulfurispiraceae bacterium]